MLNCMHFDTTYIHTYIHTHMHAFQLVQNPFTTPSLEQTRLAARSARPAGLGPGDRSAIVTGPPAQTPRDRRQTRLAIPEAAAQSTLPSRSSAWLVRICLDVRCRLFDARWSYATWKAAKCGMLLDCRLMLTISTITPLAIMRMLLGFGSHGDAPAIEASSPRFLADSNHAIHRLAVIVTYPTRAKLVESDLAVWMCARASKVRGGNAP